MTNEDALFFLTRFRTRGINEHLYEALGVAIKALSIQSEIVRCKDCKYWRDDHTCREHSLVSPMTANEFCSRAERRADK